MSLSTEINVGILRSAPGHQVFSSFLDMNSDRSPTHFCCPIVPDNEADALKTDDEDEATLSSPDSLEGDGEDSSNTASTPKAPNTSHTDKQTDPPSTSMQERPDIIRFDLDHDNHPANLTSQDGCHLKS
jgi:hypothetical protein